MSEFRQDSITGRWVVIVPARAARPDEYRGLPAGLPPSECPFCAGNESWTPPELAAYRPSSSAPNTPGWSVRTIANKFPTVASDVPATASPEQVPGESRRPGFGIHEVVIESPSHATMLYNMPSGQVREALRMVRERVREASSHPGIQAVVAFENCGPESGGSLAHPHAQLVGIPEVPPLLVDESVGLARFARTHGGVCALEAELARERAAGERVVWDSPELVAYTPFASTHPYEVRLLPVRHAKSLGDATEAEVDRLTEVLPAILRALQGIIPGASYNWVTHSFAKGRAEEAAYHWHLDLLPRLVRPDGFELGGGIAVNIMAPETAAAELRAALRPAGDPEEAGKASP